MSHTYRRGEAVEFNGAPAVILEVSTKHAGQLHIATYAGMSSYIGDQHSKLAPLGMGASRVFTERVAEIRAYYGMSIDSLGESTRTMVSLLVDYARARKTVARAQLFAYGAELATVDSLMLADVATATTVAIAQLRGSAARNEVSA